MPGRAVDILRQTADVTVASARIEQAPSPERWREALAEAEGVLCSVGESVRGPALDEAKRLRAVASMSAGADHLDLAALAARGIATVTVGPVLSECTADLAFALLLAAARRLGEGERATRSGAWQGWTPDYLCGAEVYASTLGIVGMGRIGRAVMRRSRGFGMRVLYHNRRPLAADLAEDGAYRELDDLLAESDHVMVLLPSTPETRGLLDARRLALLKPDAVLVNAGRGDVLDLDALAAVLAEGRLAGVGLDVYPREPLSPAHPILAFERVVALPHLGSATVPTRARMAETAARALVALLDHAPLPAGAVRETAHAPDPGPPAPTRLGGMA